MGGDGSNLPPRAQMYLDMAREISNYFEDHDSSSDMYKHLVVEFFNLTASAKQEISEYKEE